MLKNRKAFSFFEILLMLVILGLLAAVFVPATIKIKEDIRQTHIQNQLNTIVKEAWKYNNDKGSTTVNYKTLVESGYLPALESIAGESYESLVIGSSGTATVKTSMGKEISVRY